MNKALFKRAPLLLLLLLASSFVLFHYSKVLIHPNEYIFADSGDGIKNYYTYAYHIKHDSTYTEFEGMNYPYGENFLYTDCHPIIANLLKLMSTIFPGISNYSIGILNFLMVSSISLTAIALFFVLLELKINRWFSIFFSLSIMMLSPQIFRLGGHLALSYSLAIPISWLLVLKCTSSTQVKYIVLLFLNCLFWMYIHAYLGMIVIAFLFAFWLIQFLVDFRNKKLLKQRIWVGSMILSPILFFFIFVNLTDNHTGRTDNPSGFFHYNAEFDDILIPLTGYLRNFLDEVTGNAIRLQWEATGYLGLINVLFAATLVIISIISIFQKKARITLLSFFSNKNLNISLIAATVVLLFAMGIPFKQYPNLIEHFTVFKQFRATGRFVWPFYFVFTAFAAYGLQKAFLSFNTRKKSVLSISFLIGLLTISFAESWSYHEPTSNGITKSQNLFQEKFLPKELKEAVRTIEADKYQAILSLPFYYQGSESYARPRPNDAVKNSLLLSYHTGIPNFCANLTRTSVEESKRIVQLMTPNYYPKLIEENIKNKHPFLIVKSSDNLTKYEQNIFAKGTPIFKSNGLELLEISYQKLFSDDRNIAYNKFQNNKDDLITQKEFLVSRSSDILIYEDYEASKSDTTFRGQGSFASVKKGKNVLLEFPPNTFQKDKEYHISAWFYNNEKDALNLWFPLCVEEHEVATDKWTITNFLCDQSEVIAGNWTLVEGVFTIKDPNNIVYIATRGKMNSKAKLHIDDLLLKEKGVDVYKWNSKDSCLFMNNHKIDFE